MCISVKELVSKALYEEMGDRSLRYIDPKVISVLKLLREYFGKPIYINTWHLDPEFGNFQERGYRESGMATFRERSCHAKGRAADFHFIDYTAEEVQKAITENLYDDLKLFGLTAIEKDTPMWTHISVSCFDGWQTEVKNGIRLLKP